MKGVFLDRGSVDIGDLDLGPLETSLPDWQSFMATAPNEVRERIAGASVVVSNKVSLDGETLRSAHSLQLVCVAATGTNNVDLGVALERGIRVCNVTRYGTPSVVQHVFALVLALTTRLTDYQAAISDGRWQHSTQFCLLDYPIREIAGKTLGIVGHGELGSNVAAIGRAFGMKVLIAQRPGGKTQTGRLPLAQLLPQVDVLSLHCPLTSETTDLIGAKELALMKSDALLINTARGGIVDEQALANALREGQLGGAGVDVLSVEPPLPDNPLLGGDIPNLVVTPHIAWSSRESRQRLMDEVATNVRAYLAGKARNVVV